ncbi:MAG: hypothetical protein ACFFCP_08905 [Promethearchaeota archaeon]
MRDQKEPLIREPATTPSILAMIPETLRSALVEAIKGSSRDRKSFLISSNSLANRFIFERWGIRPSQRRRYKNLFATVRKQCRLVFENYLARGRMEWDYKSEKPSFGVYKFDEIRGNLILGFVRMGPNSL